MTKCYRNVQQHNVVSENWIEKRTFFWGGQRSQQRRQSYRGRFVRATKFSGRPHLFQVVSILCRVIIQRSIVDENWEYIWLGCDRFEHACALWVDVKSCVWSGKQWNVFEFYCSGKSRDFGNIWFWKFLYWRYLFDY